MNSSATNALVGLRRRHLVIASVFTTVAILTSVLAPPSAHVQTVILLVTVSFLGVPHGALDHLAGRSFFEPHLGNLWPLTFLALYISVSAAVVLIWLTRPLIGLMSFLLVAMIHFGSEDMEPEGPDEVLHRRSSWHQRAEVAGRGALPIVIPSALHPTEVGRIFDTLGLEYAMISGESLSGMIGSSWPAIILLLAPTFAQSMSRALAARSAEPLYSFIEVPVLATGLAVLPPLLGFVMYFIGWHSVRHTLTWVVRLDPTSAGTGLMTFVRLALPLTLATITIASGVWVWLEGSPSERAIQITFIGLAALTFPHVALEAAARLRDER